MQCKKVACKNDLLRSRGGQKVIDCISALASKTLKATKRPQRPRPHFGDLKRSKTFLTLSRTLSLKTYPFSGTFTSTPWATTSPSRTRRPGTRTRPCWRTCRRSSTRPRSGWRWPSPSRGTSTCATLPSRGRGAPWQRPKRPSRGFSSLLFYIRQPGMSQKKSYF